MAEFDLTPAVEAIDAYLHQIGWGQGDPIDVDGILGAAAPPIVRMVREQVAKEIRAELVCCDIHARIEATWDGEREVYGPQWRVLRDSTDYHPVCHYGEWSARIAIRGVPHGETTVTDKRGHLTTPAGAGSEHHKGET